MAAQEEAPRRILYQSDPGFARILREAGISLLVSTYQAGKLAAIQARGDELFLTFHNFRRAMGIAVSREQVALGTADQIWYLVSSAPPGGPEAGPFDRYLLVRGSHFTGEIHGHELEWSGRELWVVNTLFSCLCTIEGGHNFVPRWKPPFIGELAPEDRCHLNGLAMENGRPRFVTCLGASDTTRGWKGNEADGGRLIDVSNGHFLITDLCMPHSPRLYGGKLWLLESGRGRLVAHEPPHGVREVASLPGYVRGLAFHGPYAFVGLSKLRPTSTLHGVPIAGQLDALRCGVAVIELATGRQAAFLEFTSGLEEIFDVRVNPFTQRPLVSGPDARVDGTPPIWVIPPVRI
jgi:uncharacterized protein (TIGR03032 family)